MSTTSGVSDGTPTPLAKYEDDVPLAPDESGWRPMRHPRYWQVGPHVIEEDPNHWTWVLGRASLGKLHRKPRVIGPGDPIPRALYHAADYDGVLAAVERAVRARAETGGFF